MPNKKIVTMLLLCVMLTGMAQRYDRNAFTFKSSLVKNAEGEITHVKVGAYVAGKQVQEFTTETDGVPESTTIDNVGKITEGDLNGDNLPDVSIDLGYYGHGANDHYYEALIWDQKQGLFLQAEGYKDLSQPMIDEKTGMLYTVGRYSPDEMQTDYYRWQRNRVELVRSEIWRIDGKQTDFSGLLDLPLYRFDVQINGKIPAVIAFQENSDHIVAGYIYYPKASKPAPIMIAGFARHQANEDRYFLNEYQAGGLITGEIFLLGNLQIGEVEEGTWKNPKTGNVMNMTDISFRRDAPKWFTKSLLSSKASLQDIYNKVEQIKSKNR